MLQCAVEVIGLDDKRVSSCALRQDVLLRTAVDEVLSVIRITEIVLRHLSLRHDHLEM